MPKAVFNDQYTALQQKTITRLADIEAQDRLTCESCGGEDCVCCEIYADRQKWVSPAELFNDEDPFADWRDGCESE